MSFCCGCGKKNTRTRLINPINNKCNDCMPVTSTAGFNGNFASQNTPNTQSNINNSINSSNGMNAYLLSSTQYSNNADNTIVESNISENNLNSFLNKPTNELTHGIP